MATATTTTETQVTGVALELSLKEAETLLEYLTIEYAPSGFRLQNISIYKIEETLREALNG